MDKAHAQAFGGNGFNGLGIAPGLLSVLATLGYKTPTPIQVKAIPSAIEGKDVIGVAQTGTGKTLAFGVPLLQRLAQTNGRGLILLPTRELAQQVEEELHKIGKPFHLRTALLIGGASMGEQIRKIKADPHVIIATPGRLNDHLEQRKVSLSKIGILILDEADRMLDMGFWPQIKRILVTLPKDRQTMLFSATLSKEIMELATTHMKLPTRIEVAPPGTTVDKVSQEFFIVRKEDKMRLLEKVLGERTGSAIVFTRTKHGATRVKRGVERIGHTAAEIHSNRSLSQRRAALDGFKAGKYRILVATDIAARGLDVKGIEMVVNYDLPSQSEDYVHRIGRTARAGASGHAISFAMPDEKRDIRNIERLIKKTVPVSQVSELPPSRGALPYIPDAPVHQHHARPHGGVHGGRRPFHSGGASSSAPRPFHGRRFGGPAKKRF